MIPHTRMPEKTQPAITTHIESARQRSHHLDPRCPSHTGDTILNERRKYLVMVDGTGVLIDSTWGLVQVCVREGLTVSTPEVDCRGAWEFNYRHMMRESIDQLLQSQAEGTP